jgi:hypothetical protein
VAADTGCIIVSKTIIRHGFSDPVSFTVDLKDAGMNVVHTRTFSATGMQAFLNVPVGDYTVVEQNPGPAWKQRGDYNTPVHVTAGTPTAGTCSGVSMANEYNLGCIVVSKAIIRHGFPDTVNFAVDLKDSGMNVIDTKTFSTSDTRGFLNLAPGDYTVVEQNPGPAWKQLGDYNTPVHVIPGTTCSPVSMANEYNRGCIIVKKVVLDYPSTDPVSFTVDLRDSANDVVGTKTFSAGGTQGFLNVPVGDYTVVEQNPGSGWEQLGDYNTPVQVSPGDPSADNCKLLTIANRYHAVPTACVDLTVTSTCTGAHLSWSEYGSASKYAVYRSTVSGGPYTYLASATNNYYDDPAVVVGTTYYYVVRPAAATYEICQSNEASATISSCLPTTEFPSLFLPALMIIGVLGSVFLIQRTREQ